MPPFLPLSLASSLLRSLNGIRFSCPFTHLTFPSVRILRIKKATYLICGLSYLQSSLLFLIQKRQPLSCLSRRKIFSRLSFNFWGRETSIKACPYTIH
nr:MAG TPA: hypothetical protein [Caudoviricetes sp.]DAS41890.1 MAG TPA: hypothetical protein [Caudoviricetes sp.]